MGPTDPRPGVGSPSCPRRFPDSVAELKEQGSDSLSKRPRGGGRVPLGFGVRDLARLPCARLYPTPETPPPGSPAWTCMAIASPSRVGGGPADHRLGVVRDVRPHAASQPRQRPVLEVGSPVGTHGRVRDAAIARLRSATCSSMSTPASYPASARVRASAFVRRRVDQRENSRARRRRFSGFDLVAHVCRWVGYPRRRVIGCNPLR